MPAVAVVTLIAAVLAPGDSHDIALTAAPADELIVPAPTVAELSDGDVLTIRVSGGVEGARGNVQQCVRTVTAFLQCTNRFPMLFDADGRAIFQYQLVDPGRCGPTSSCVVVVRDELLRRAAYAFTVFEAAAPPPPSVTVSPSGPYAEGDEVRVEIANLTPGASIEAAFCGTTCSSPRRATAGENGTATTVVPIGARCEDCGIAVVAAAGSSFTEIQFVSPPSADYDWPRLAAGLTAAAAFLILAWLIVATVDWRPPSEAQTPELDGPAVG
jgi:hypothetical protein